MAMQAERWSELPNFHVEQFDPTVIWETTADEAHCTVASTQSVSTYPILPHGERDGDPNCDQVFIQLHKSRAIVALADGCNWGRMPQQAARSATAAIKAYLASRTTKVNDLHEAAHLLLRAFAEADKKIMEGKEFHWEAGTTTLLSGILLRFKQDNEETPKWGFVCCSVGDCKAFHFSHSKNEVTDITAGNRANVTDTRDPGGRLGPYLEGGAPDLRNLCLYFIPCEENDLLVIVSDGVHDNLDPQMLGKSPSDLGLGDGTWDSTDTKKADDAKTTFRTDMMLKLITKAKSKPPRIVEKLTSHCFNTTKNAREFMETHPMQKQPDDYSLFPGKMDHTTSIVLKVCEVEDVAELEGSGSNKNKGKAKEK